MNLPDFLTQDKYGYIHFAGHRIGLRHVVELYNDSCSPEMVLDHYPTLSLALIHKVIGFYLENRADVDAYVQQSRAAIEKLAAEPSPGPSAEELRRRLEAKQKQRESA